MPQLLHPKQIGPKKTTPTPAANTPAAAPVASVAPPTAPSLTAATIDGSTVSTTNQTGTTKPIIIEQSKPLILSGTTVPNGTITLTIHSTPRTVTVQADSAGKWSYTVANLEPGDHYVEAAVTDPTTGKTSDVMKLVSFTVAKAAAAPVPAKKTSPSTWVWALTGAAVVLVGLGGWWVWRLRRKKSDCSQDDNQNTPPASPTNTGITAGLHE